MKTAARLWGHPEDETETSFDPLVNVLFSACALELEKISNEVHTSRARLLERMVQLLSPEVLSGPLPAHAVMHARTLDDAALLIESDQFMCSQKTGNSYETTGSGYKDLYFAPAGNFHINNAVVTYLATGHQLFRYREMISKEVITHCLPEKELEQRVLWIGLAGEQLNLHNTQIYFEIRNEVSKELFFKNLPQARWFYGDQELQVRPGYNQDNISSELLNVEQLLVKKNTASWKFKEFVNAYYKPRFITIRHPENNEITGNAGWPAALLQAFDKKELQSLQADKVHWIKVQFPENISSSVLQDAICHINCFPVLNTRLHETVYAIRDILNIVPMYTNDLFFDLQQIADLDDNVYNIRTLEKNVHEKLTVILRQGGVGRFDERDASMIIEHIVQLLSDEGAAFSVLGRSFLTGELKQLQQIIYKLEQQMINRDLSREFTPFLVIRKETDEAMSNLIIKYWSTCGDKGNDIKAGTGMQVYNTNSPYHTTCTLVTTTMGGRNRLSASESITAYKSALLSRDRLISLEDMKIFCRLQMGAIAQQIEVTKGVMVPRQVSQGFTRTIDITIRLNRKDYMDAQDKNQLQYWKDSLVLQLTERSASLTPFRVFIEQET